jgi:hypothetical protein
MVVTNTTNPNILYPTKTASIAGTPSETAYKQMQINNERQNNLNASFKGGKQEKNKGKGGGYEAPQFVMPYNTSGTNPNTLIAGNAQISVQSAENAKYDSLALQHGGNPNWDWGCYSGGNKKKTNKRKTNKRNTNKRKTNKRKTNKRKTNKRKTNKRKTNKRNTNS